MALTPQARQAAIQLITSEALARHLDPKAVLAVGSQEGLGGGIGDGGHAFGPFQLNNAGGVITGKFPGQPAQQINQWAWSPEGIRYALDGIAKVASGLHGPAAVSNIVSRFERPANIPGETAGAIAAYGGQPAPSPLMAGGLTPQVPQQQAPGLAPLIARLIASNNQIAQAPGPAYRQFGG